MNCNTQEKRPVRSLYKDKIVLACISSISLQGAHGSPQVSFLSEKRELFKAMLQNFPEASFDPVYTRFAVVEHNNSESCLLAKRSSCSSFGIHSPPACPPNTKILVPPSTQVLWPQANLGGCPGTSRILHEGFSSGESNKKS